MSSPVRARPGLLDWIFTAPFLLVFGTLLLVFDPLQRIARRFGRRPQEATVGALQVGLLWCLRLAGTRVHVERSSAVRPGQPYLLVSNHQSMFDIPIFGALLFSNYPKYVSKRELAKGIPSISYNLREGGNAIIDRSDREQATRAIRELGAQVRERGVAAVIFPEGTRARGGELAPFKPAGVFTLLEAAPQTPVVPVVIDGSWSLLRHNLLPVPFGTRIRVRICDPIARHADEDPAALLAELRGQIEKSLAAWRGTSGKGDPKAP